MPREIASLADDMLRDPVKVSVTPVSTTVERVEQHVYLVASGAKRDLLVELMGDHDLARAIVFTRTKRGADRVTQHLDSAGVGADAIHGNKSQSQRQRALDDFRRGRTRVLVATDIAARGIDVDGVTHVVNFELPETPEAYVHRIGRTARAGANGKAISLCDNGERSLLRAIEKLTRQTLPTTDRRTAGAAKARANRPSRTPQQHRRPHERSGRRGGRKRNGHSTVIKTGRRCAAAKRPRRPTARNGPRRRARAPSQAGEPSAGYAISCPPSRKNRRALCLIFSSSAAA